MKRLFGWVSHLLCGVLSPSERGACARRPACARVEPEKTFVVHAQIPRQIETIHVSDKLVVPNVG